MRETVLFSAVVTPHRSLGRRGLVAVMLGVAAAGVVLGGMFVITGAWPVAGFLGLDVVLVYCAFKASDRQALAREHVLVTAGTLQVRRVSHRGAIAEWTMNPLWVRLQRDVDPDYGTLRLALVSRGRSVTVGQWLAPAERDEFAVALTRALRTARHGPPPAPAGPPGNRVDRDQDAS